MRRATEGFTLIEVLLAISLLALLLVLVASAANGARRTLALTERFGNRLDEIRATQLFLRRELQQILPLPLTGSAPGAAVVFSGEAGQMRFIASLPAYQGGGLYEQTLELGNTQAQAWLQVAFIQLTGPHGRRAWGEPQRLLRDVQGLRFAYQGLDPEGLPTPWLPRWPWPQRLPRQIEIHLQAHGSIPWPPLTVALRLEPQAITEGAP